MPSKTHKPALPNGSRSGAAHRREIERLTRELLKYAEGHPLHRFAAGTRRFLEEARPIVEQLDVIEGGRGAAAVNKR